MEYIQYFRQIIRSIKLQESPSNLPLDGDASVCHDILVCMGALLGSGEYFVPIYSVKTKHTNNN